ncbi:MAG: cupin domain-containing protein [Deltaproteobacteria bacterium]|nr:cupin domain-containing protein [Deltaproteobacteria bacterium]
MARPIRRIVTGHDAQGRSVILMDGDAPNVRERPGGGAVTNIWTTDSAPASNRGSEDMGSRLNTLQPPPNGAGFRIVEYPPDSARFAAGTKEDTAFRDAGLGRAAATDTSRHPGMHKTNSIDYALVLSGEIYAVMDEGETLMRPGDCLIQRGTSHAWSNRSNEPCLVAFVLIDAEPL